MIITRLLFLTVLYTCFILLSCNNYEKNEKSSLIVSDTIINYDNCEEFNLIFPDSIISFFPFNNNICKKTTICAYAGNSKRDTSSSYYRSYFEVYYVAIIYKFKSNSYIKTIKKELYDNSIFSFDQQDTTYYIIDSEIEFLERYSLTQIEKELRVERPLVPNFHRAFRHLKEFYDKNTLSGLKENYRIYILNYNNTFVLEEEYKTEWDILSEHNKHGYSSGVAYNENDVYIIYWAVAW